MIKIENVEVTGFRPAIRGMRNPMNSWDKSDSAFMGEPEDQAFVGEADLDLMNRLAGAGTDHSKYLRMIVVYADVVAPLYWWKEFDTYKVGTVANSCSTMHKIHAKEFTIDDFSVDRMDVDALHDMHLIVCCLNNYRTKYLASGKNKRYWWDMIQILPSSYNQRRTVMLSYQVLKNMYNARKNHKLDEWREFCKWIKTLPYSELITGKKVEE